MDPKCLITKSKSNNNAITTKLDKNNKKCRSNAEFQPHVVKKRGVYVEKRPTTLSIHNTDTTNEQDTKTVKQIPKPRPGSKKFVASVLSILSKSTRATQYPDQLKKEKKQAINSKLISGKAETSHGLVLANLPKTKPKKFRSKVLNNIEENKNFDQEHLLILKSKKDIIESPSNYSGTNSFRLPEVSSFIQHNYESNLLKNDLEAEDDGISREILKRKKRKVEKKVRINDPVTLVEDTDKNHKDDILYDFFLDLIDKKVSAHNMKDKCTSQAKISSPVKSNYNLEIEESVYKKLNVKKDLPEMFDDITQKSRSRTCCVKDNNLDGPNFFDLIKNTTPYRQKFPLKPTRSPVRPIRNKLKTQSFTYPNKKRSFSNTFNKKILLNEFKQQLKMDLESLEEPQNFYQALKTMAKNKRKRHEALHSTALNKYSANECILKRRRIIYGSPKFYKKKRQDLKPTLSMSKYIDNINSKKYKTARALKKEDSYQSLEVYSYDHDVSSKSKDGDFDEFLISPSYSTQMESQMNIDVLSKYTDSDFIKNMKSFSQNMDLYESDG